MGVVLYMIIFNSPPFKGKNSVQVMESIMKDEAHFKGKCFFSTEAIDFVKTLLAKEPKNRPSAKKALEHIWLCHSSQKLIKKDSK